MRAAGGNLLVVQGFERIAPPEGTTGYSSVYRLAPVEGIELVLRGFGLFWGERGTGGVVLRRFGFAPQWTAVTRLSNLPWKESDLPPLSAPLPQEQDDCLRMVGDLCAWVCRYERWVNQTFGRKHRHAAHAAWPKAPRDPIPFDLLEEAWGLVAEGAWRGDERFSPPTARRTKPSRADRRRAALPIA